MRARRGVRPVLLLVATLAWQGVTRADETSTGASAVQLGYEGLERYQEGQWEDALQRFEQANEIMYSPVFLLYMARCLRSLNRLQKAAEQLTELLARAPEGTVPAAWNNAIRDGRAELEALRRRIPSVRIAKDQVASVSIDEIPVHAGELISLDPGEHVVRAISVDGRFSMRRLELREGEQNIVVLLTFARKPTTASPTTTTSTTPTTTTSTRPKRLEPFHLTPNKDAWRTSTWIAGGFALASATVGTIAGLVAKSQLDSVRKRCDGRVCPPELEGEVARARRLANVSTAAFGIAGLDLAFSVSFLVLPPWTDGAKTGHR